MNNKKIIKKESKSKKNTKPNPRNPKDRRDLARISIQKTVEKYPTLLKMLGTE
ncbi:MAG: hypothetical protein ABIE03_07065 [Patescibacteria group bacterium]|nr:hypothetical protein [Patescibacteria group bacterium]